MTRVNLSLPDPTYELLTKLSKEKQMNLSTIVSMALKYYDWILEQNKNDFRILAKKTDTEKELNVI